MTTQNELTIEIIGFTAICPKCGESDIRNLEILESGEVIGCECGFNAVPAVFSCPCCGESDMDNIIPPDEYVFFECLTCGQKYEVN